MSKRAILVDGDILAYKVASAVEKPIHWGDGTWTLHADEAEAGPKAEQLVDGWARALEASDILVCLSDPKVNWRKSVLPTYKEQRGDNRKPLLLTWLREEFLPGMYNTFQRPTLEADDVLGILATAEQAGGLQGYEKIIVSEDKDLCTIPGLLVNPRHSNEDVPLADVIQEISEDDADRYFYMQALTGDQVDNFVGCPGVGPKTAEKILDKAWDDGPEAVWAAILEAYAKQDLDEDFALTQARVARICRASDYDFKRKEVKLWEPSRD